MKKLFQALFFSGSIHKLVFQMFLSLGLCSVVYAVAPPNREQAMTGVGTGTTVSVSTSTWTKLPATSSLTGRHGVHVSNDSANSAYMAAITSSNSSSPSEATTVRVYYVSPGATLELLVGDAIYVYALYLGAAPGNAHVQEFKQ